MRKYYIFFYIFLVLGMFFQNRSAIAQGDFLLQGWYWDYPKTTNGFLWADTLRLKAQELADAGFTHVWLPPLSRASFGSNSNGYDPKDLFDLGEFGNGATGFGTRADVDALISQFNSVSIKAVADVVYNHRDGGKAEDNPAVAGWIRNMTATKINNGDQPYPSDRFRIVLPIGGSTGFGAGNYFFKIRSKSQHSNFYGKDYKFYVQTNRVGFKGLTALNESEPNGGGDCGEGNNTAELGRDMLATVDNGGCGLDEFALTLTSSDFFAAGDTLFITLTNPNGNYSDHTVHGLYYDGTASDIENALVYQTFTDFTSMPSGQGGMNYLNFKPNGNPTQLSGDLDFPFFFYDYDQNVQSTRDVLYGWTRWLWNDVGIRGFRMDAVKHFPRDFVGDLLDNLHDNGIDPGLVVGEFFDGNTAVLKGWVDEVLSNMDADTKAAITPRIFDFSLHFTLEDADELTTDVRNIFNASIVDASGASGFNVITFVNNHDFRDGDQPVENDPILSYAYTLTNNQIGLPSVFYFDYYNRGLKSQINELISIHNSYIFGATQRDYLSRIGTPYHQNFTSGFDSNTLLYQLSGMASNKDVIVAINFANVPLTVTHGVNTTGMNLSIGDRLFDLIGNNSGDFVDVVDVGGNGAISINIPARSYTVFRQIDASESDPPTASVSAADGSTVNATLSDPGAGIISVEVKTANNATVQIGGQAYGAGQKFITAPAGSVSLVAAKTGNTAKVELVITDGAGNRRVWVYRFFD